MSATNSTSIAQLIAELAFVDSKAEIVDGKIIHMSPSGPRHNRVANRICRSLEAIEESAGGCAYGDNVGFVVNLPNRSSFSPDAAFCHTPPPSTEEDDDFIEGAPAFAVEVRSKGDYGIAAEREMARKRQDYFAAGTQVVWDVSLKSDDVIRVYRSDNPTEPTIYRRGQVAEAEPAVPGWKMPVDDIFE